MFRRFIQPLTIVLLLVMTACRTAPTALPSDEGAGRIELSACLSSSPGQSTLLAARCGELTVPEDYENPEGRRIRLHVVVIPAASSNPSSDPVFLLAGGPGQAATQVWPMLVPALQKISFKHAIVLVDQRGTGGSNALHCDTGEAQNLADARFPSPQEITAAYQKCVAGWDADTRRYTTAHFVRDLEEVRKTLGYGQINLAGVSYGTRSALAYLSAYPQRVRTLILDGIVPPGWALGSAMRRDAQNAMQDILSRCTADQACREAFPSLPEGLDRLLSDLRARPQEVTLPDPLTGRQITLTLDDQSASTMLRLISYSSFYSALIPWLIHSAVEGDLQPLAAQFLISASEEGSIESGLFYAVFCAEDMPWLKEETGTESYYTDPVPLMKAACAAYPANPVEKSAYPKGLQTPTLIVSGGADPVTPPANGAEVAALLTNSRHIILPGMGHGNLTSGCITDLAAQFIDEGGLEKLDLACAGRIKPPPFFLSPLGPQP